MALGEFELIDRIKNLFSVPKGMLGIGDDCAVIPQKSGLETLVSTDMLMEGVHFLIEDVQAFDLGWKSAAVNISDIAGMGGKPQCSFLSFALPKSLDDQFMTDFIKGYKALSDRYCCPLLGGDTTSSPDRLCISVTVMGICPEGQSRKRSDARIGDFICTTGNVGDSGAGLKVILREAALRSRGLVPPKRTFVEKSLIERHYRPIPRVDAGLLLASYPGVHAMMDISDGIGSDLRHILKESGVGAEVDTSCIPTSPELLNICSVNGWEVLDIALDGGEDYELLFTISPNALEEVRGLMKHANCHCHVIGNITAENSGQICWKGCGKEHEGFRHF